MALGMTNPNSKIGDCEVCDKTNIDVSLHYGNMWFCDDCWEKESKFTAENNTPEVIQARVSAVVNKPTEQASIAVNSVLSESKKIDSTIQVRTDLFNAATTAIMDLKKSIDDDATITNKPFALASALSEKFEHLKTVVFELNEKLVEAGNHQKAIQVYLNQLANQLRAEERERLKLADINYKPIPPKSVTKISTRQTSKKTKLDLAELRKYASEIGVTEFTLRMIVIQKGCSIAEAATIIKESIEAGKAK